MAQKEFKLEIEGNADWLINLVEADVDVDPNIELYTPNKVPRVDVTEDAYVCVTDIRARNGTTFSLSLGNKQIYKDEEVKTHNSFFGRKMIYRDDT